MLSIYLILNSENTIFFVEYIDGHRFFSKYWFDGVFGNILRRLLANKLFFYLSIK